MKKRILFGIWDNVAKEFEYRISHPKARVGFTTQADANRAIAQHNAAGNYGLTSRAFEANAIECAIAAPKATKPKYAHRPNGEGNRWMVMVDHRGCIFPCGGKPVIKTKPGKVRVGADDLPAYLQCSECGYTPGVADQPELVRRFLKYYIKHERPAVIAKERAAMEAK